MARREDDVECMDPIYDFDLFSHYYDLDQGAYMDDIPLYLDLAKRTGSPLFELGCGSGRLLLPLAEAGYRVTGLDVASAMLDIARRKISKAGLTDNVTLVQDDMRSFHLEERFQLGFCAMNTLMHVASLKDQLAVLQAAHRHLRPGGLFVIDLPNPHVSVLPDEQTPLLLEKEMVDPNTGHHILKLFSQRVDLTTQVADITLIFDEIDRRGSVRRTLVPLQMRWLYPYEARLLLEAAGFTVDQVYGTYDLEPFQARDERMIFISRVA